MNQIVFTMSILFYFMALGEAQLVSSLYTPQRLGSIAQKLNDTNRLSAKNARKHTKTRENMRKTREKHAKSPGNQAKNTQSARQKLGKPPKNTRFLPLLQESHLKITLHDFDIIHH